MQKLLTPIIIVLMFSTSLNACKNVGDSVQTPSPTLNITEKTFISVEELQQYAMTPVDEMIRAENYTRQEVWELDDYDKYISAKSNNNAFMFMDCIGNGTLYTLVTESNQNLGEYYWVVVGEKWNDHRIPWDNFFVSKNIDQIFYYDVIQSNLYTLSEWRNNPPSYSDRRNLK